MFGGELGRSSESELPVDVIRHTVEWEDPQRGTVDIVVVGRLGNSESENSRALGVYGALHLSKNVKKAHQEGLLAVYNFPTGASPRSQQSELRRMLSNGSSVALPDIWFGHEQALPESGELNYGQQQLDILADYGVSPKIINTIEQVLKTPPEGNYVPMFLGQLEGNEDTQEVLEVAAQSNLTRDQILEKLLQKGARFIGHYGVGIDVPPHGYGEFGQQHMHPNVWEETWNSFGTSIDSFSYERGLWRNPQDDDFHNKDNALEYRKADNFPEAKVLMGLGRKIINEEHAVMHIINSPTKTPALKHILQSLMASGARMLHENRGDITESMQIQEQVDEAQLTDSFKAEALNLQRNGYLEHDLRQVIKGAATIDEILGIVYSNINQRLPEEVYYPLWRLMGKRSPDGPVSRLTIERSFGGKDISTEFVVPAHALQGNLDLLAR